MTYSAIVLADAPLFYWKCDDASGALTDATGNSVTGTAEDGAHTYHTTGIAPDSTYAITLGGRTYSSTSTWASSTHTVEFWIKGTGLTGDRMIAGFPYATGRVLFYSGGVLGYNAGGGECYGATVSLFDNNVHHVVAIFQSGSTFAAGGDIWFDGVQQTLGGAGGSSSFNSPNGFFRIGGWNSDNSLNITGAIIDDVAVYDYALDPVQIISHYTNSQIIDLYGNPVLSNFTGDPYIPEPFVGSGQTISPAPLFDETITIGTPYVVSPIEIAAWTTTLDSSTMFSATWAGWAEDWRDDFSGSSVNTTDWNVRNNTTQSNTHGVNLSSCVTVSGGILSISTGLSGNPSFPWKMGYIDTIGKKYWSEGYWEIRCRFPWGTTAWGYWPAFWLRPEDGGLGEIDMMEAWPKKNDVHQTIWRDYTGTPHKEGSHYGTPSFDPTQWHTYGIEKSTGVLRFYIDGVMVWDATHSTSWVAEAFDRAVDWNIRLNLQMGDGGYGGDPTGSTNLSQTYDIDWVRHMTITDGGGPGAGGGGVVVDPTTPVGGSTDGSGGDTGTSSGSGGSSTGSFTLFFGSQGVRPAIISGGTLTAASQPLRALMSSSITMPDPVIVQGRPYLPLVPIKPASSMTFNVGPSNIHTFDPPTPTVTPPGGTTHYWGWDAVDLADPPGTHGFYNLTSWAETSGSGPSWVSSGVYTPRVADKVVYGAENAYHTYTRSVHFDASNVEHMWIDLGSHSQPFTWVICGMINYYPYRTFGHYILDAGKPTAQRDITRDWTFDEGLDQRSLMLFQSRTAVLATHTGKDAVANGKHVIAPHNEIARPRVFFGVFNGSASFVGSIDRYNNYGKTGSVDNHTHRYFVLGRRQNHVSNNLASHMTLFEIRFFNKALSANERATQYKQLASKWRFNKYGSGT